MWQAATPQPTSQEVNVEVLAQNHKVCFHSLYNFFLMLPLEITTMLFYFSVGDFNHSTTEKFLEGKGTSCGRK